MLISATPAKFAVHLGPGEKVKKLFTIAGFLLFAASLAAAQSSGNPVRALIRLAVALLPIPFSMGT